MNLRRYEPWSLLARVQQDTDRLFGNRFGGTNDSEGTVAEWVPAVDIHEEDDRFVLFLDVPGVDPADIELTMEDGVLTIQGARKHEAREEKDGYQRIERVKGKFYRRFTLPDTADAKDISAKSAHGVLEIVIPKAAQAKPRRISVKVA